MKLQNCGKSKPFWVLEDIETIPRRKLFTMFGVDWLATPFAWLSILIFCAFGSGIALLVEDATRFSSLLLGGARYGLLLYLANVIHTLGHLLSGKIVHSPMDANLLTATFDVNLYVGDQSRHDKLVHIGRALGGPALNLLMGMVAIGVGRQVGVAWVKAFGFINLASGVWTLLPIFPMDGWLIWKKLAT